MALKKFDLRALVELDDGRIRTALEQAFKRAELDCADRPGLKDARKCNLAIAFSPVLDENGEFHSCDVTFQVSDSLPKRKSKVYNMRASGTGAGLFFNEMSPEDADQLTLEMEGEGRPSTIPITRKKGGA